jgi:hypothetical protein
VEPLPGARFRIDIELRCLPGLGVFSASRSALRSEKPKDLFSDGNDQIFINLEGEALAQQFGREIVLEPGDAIAFSGCDPGSLTKGGKLASLIFPRRAFDLLLRILPIALRGRSAEPRPPYSSSPAISTF